MREELVFRAEVLVDARNPLMDRQISERSPGVICRSRCVGKRHILIHDVQRHRVETAGGNNVAGERGAIQRIDDLAATGKIASLLRGSQNHGGTGRLGDGPESFIAGEEKGLVVNDGAAESGSELVLLQDILGARRWDKKVSGVEVVIPEELERVAMILVGSRLDLDIGVRAGAD